MNTRASTGMLLTGVFFLWLKQMFQMQMLKTKKAAHVVRFYIVMYVSKEVFSCSVQHLVCFCTFQENSTFHGFSNYVPNMNYREKKLAMIVWTSKIFKKKGASTERCVLRRTVFSCRRNAFRVVGYFCTFKGTSTRAKRMSSKSSP